MTDPLRQRLEQVRHRLLILHKALLDSERVTYEQTVGRIESPYQFLQLVIRDPWFAWLQPLSQLIVSMDEALDSKDPVADSDVEALIKEAGVLLVSSETGEGFSRHYFEAMQREPDVVLAHGELKKLLANQSPPRA